MANVNGVDCAFPVQETYNPNHGDCVQYGAPGMDLRTYIATQVLNGLLAKHTYENFYDAASDAVTAADELIKRLNK